jgi:hypothetical protein
LKPLDNSHSETLPSHKIPLLDPSPPRHSSTMSDSPQKSCLRDNSGPRVVDAGREKGRSGGKRQKDAEDSVKNRTRHSSTHTPSKPDSSHRRKTSSASAAASIAKDGISARPVFELDVIGQPPRTIAYGTTVETVVVISLRLPSAELASRYASTDTSKLLAVVSLVEESRSGECKPMESGTVTGQQMSDSVHPIPQEHADTLARKQPCRVALGYVSFPALLIRQPGLFRLRVTLIKICSSTSGGGSAVLSVDSDPIRVERRQHGSSSQRKHARI